MTMTYLLAICFVIGQVFSGDGTCSVALPSSDERSCDFQNSQNAASNTENRASQWGNYRAPEQFRRASQSEDFVIHESSSHSSGPVTRSQYEQAIKDAAAGKLEQSIPILRKAAKSFNNDRAYVNLCAFLLNYGHTIEVNAAEKLYQEALENCLKGLELNPHNQDGKENLEAIRTSREIRDIIPKSPSAPPSAGRFVGQRKKSKNNRKKKLKATGEAKVDEEVGEKFTMGFNEVYTEREEALRIYPGKMDDGDLEFNLHNGSSVNPRALTLRLGEVYVEDDFISKSELAGLIAIIDRDLLALDISLEKGPKGSVYHSTLLSLSSHLSTEERLLIAHIRERVVNRANDFRTVETAMYSYLRGVRAHATAMLRYTKSGRHNVHHDNDFVNRCLSASIGLSDDFEGGDFNLHTTKNVNDRTLNGFPIIGSVKAKAGRLMLFLSESMNSVSELKSGARDTLYVWMTCDVDAEYQLDDPLEPVDDRKVWVPKA